MGRAEIIPVNLIRIMPAEESEMTFIKNDQELQSPQPSLTSHRWSIVIGNLLEHFDSSLYGFLAPLVGKTFFPSYSPLYQLILTYSVYVVTFLARSLGGI